MVDDGVRGYSSPIKKPIKTGPFSRLKSFLISRVIDCISWKVFTTSQLLENSLNVRFSFFNKIYSRVSVPLIFKI